MRIWKIVASVGVGVALLAAGYFLTDRVAVSEWMDEYAEEQPIQEEKPEEPQPVVLYGMVVNDLQITEDVVKRNQRFSDLFQGYYVPAHVQQQLSLLSRDTFDFRKFLLTRSTRLFQSPIH